MIVNTINKIDTTGFIIPILKKYIENRNVMKLDVNNAFLEPEASVIPNVNKNIIVKNP